VVSTVRSLAVTWIPPPQKNIYMGGRRGDTAATFHYMNSALTVQK